MTLAETLRLLDGVEATLAKLRAGLPELNRRARISSRRDGYPRVASGAQTSTGPAARGYVVEPRMVPGGWGWGCSCGAVSLAGWGWDDIASALEAGRRHIDACHPGSSSLDYVDPTGGTATAIADSTPRLDPVLRRHRRAVSAIVRMARNADIALAQLREPENTDDNSAWCALCATIKHDDGRPYLSPPDSRVKGATTVAGVLKEPMVLCSWHYDYISHERAIPPRPVTLEYVTKGRMARRTT